MRAVSQSHRYVKVTNHSESVTKIMRADQYVNQSETYSCMHSLFCSDFSLLCFPCVLFNLQRRTFTLLSKQ